MKILGPIITSRTIGYSYLQLKDAISYAKKNNFKKIILNEPHPKTWARFILLCQKNQIEPIILLNKGEFSYLIIDNDSMIKAIQNYNKNVELNLKKLKMNIDNIIYPNNLLKNLIKKEGFILSDSEKLTFKMKYFENINSNFDLKKININFPNLGGFDEIKNEIKNEINKNKFSLNEKIRLDKELKIIKAMNVSDYILNVKKIVDIAKDNNIITGPGRGSSVGSLVINKLGINRINPLDFNLYFERFLNINRKQLPDIDLDIESERRNELIEKLQNFYGKYNVAFIRTLSTMKYKSVIKKAEELLGYKSNVKLSLPIRNPENFKFLKKFSKEDKIFYRLAYFLEGLEQAESTHAAGVIISKNSLIDYIPLEKKKIPIIEWTMEDLYEIGIEKFDILSLDTLSFLKKLNYNENYEKHIEPKILKNFSYGLTKGIFQLDSYSGKNIVKKIKPKNFEEISISIALNRPGPLESGMVEDYVTSHSDNYLKQLLPETKGVIVYQEQIMYLAQKLGNLNFEESDILRRALSKKNSNAIMKLKNKFMINATKKIGEKKAKELFEKIENFSQYSFNKSHSIAYSFILKWLLEEKFLTPAKFFYNYILHKGLDTEVINECNFLGIKILNPDIEIPQGNFDEKKIILPMSFISGVSNKIILSFQNIKFKTIDDFFHFVYNNNFSRNLVEQIIKSGALDKIDKNRRNLLRKMTEYKKGQLPEIEDLKSSVFGEKSEKHKEVETNEEMIIEYEFESIKFPLSIINNEKLSTSLIKKYFDYYENISFDGYAYKNYLFDNSAIIKNKYFYKKPKKIIKEI